MSDSLGVLSEEDVYVVLEGGPAAIARIQRVTASEAAYGKVKIAYLAGYEHFERVIDPSDDLVFRWTARTKIAE
ncbi:DUF5988 family protein [Microbispora sp. NPDC049125]|uniref:DUF5988 family protein n=1 Tax=Microbispora sp. NPDC049125 TaxID=3154929 RepID=UPI0034655FAF